jgi:hypothetical protein
MKPHIIAIATAAALAAGIGSASAADNQAMTNNTAKKPMAPAAQSMSQDKMAQDNLTLTPSQERAAWRDIAREASSQTAPSNFAASVGTAVPGDITLRSVPARVARHVSALKPYDYALIEHKLLIVNPTDKKVVDVINRRA